MVDVINGSATGEVSEQEQKSIQQFTGAGITSSAAAAMKAVLVRDDDSDDLRDLRALKATTQVKCWLWASRLSVAGNTDCPFANFTHKRDSSML